LARGLADDVRDEQAPVSGPGNVAALVL